MGELRPEVHELQIYHRDYLNDLAVATYLSYRITVREGRTSQYPLTSVTYIWTGSPFGGLAFCPKEEPGRYWYEQTLTSSDS
jgi:hypothetical protein